MRQGFLKDCFATLCDGTHFYGGWLQLLRLLDFHSLDALADQLSKVPVLEPFLEFGIMFECCASPGVPVPVPQGLAGPALERRWVGAWCVDRIPG